ncbi:MAG: sugar ABC transporter substrate-binding protein [Actinomycetota bacterium]
MKKILFITLIVCVFALSACNPSQDTESGETDTITEGETSDIESEMEEADEGEADEVEEESVWDFNADPVTISVLSFFSTDDLSVEQSVVDAFAEAYPNINVEYDNLAFGDYFDFLVTNIAGGVVPDVMAMNFEQGARFAAMGALEDLTPYIEAENYNLDKYFTSTVDMHRHEGIQSGLPATFSIVVNFINKDLFDEAGIAYPDETWVWEDLIAAAKEMTKDIDGDGIIDQFGYIAGWWPNFVFQNGAQIINDEGRCGLNTPEAIEGLQIYVDITLDSEQKIAPDRSELNDAGDWDRFQGGSVAIIPTGPWAITPFKENIGDSFEWDVAPFTSINEPSTLMYGNSYTMSSTSEQKAAAWEFIKFATGERGSTLRQSGGYEISPIREIATSDFISSLNGVPENAHYILDATSYATLPCAHPLWQEMHDIIWPELEMALQGTKSVEDAMSTACQAVDALLEEYGY